jgi:tetratricopeptide (TPR) repeat protein
MVLHQRLKEREAVPLLEKALAIDPTFAMAMAKLSVIYNNLGLQRESTDYARRAFERADRLTERERLYVEGVHYSRRPETADRAIEAYRRAIARYPDHESARNNLALIATLREDDDEVVTQLEELRRLGGEFPSSYAMLAGAYVRKGDAARAQDVLQAYLRRSPDSGAGYSNLGGFLVSQDRLDEAAAAFEKARALGARELQILLGEYHIAILRNRADEAEAVARRLTSGSDVFGRSVGWFGRAQTALYRGRSAEAVALLNEAIRGAPFPLTAAARTRLAALHAHRGELVKALAEADQARREAKEAPEKWDAVAVQAAVQARMGRSAAAQEHVSELHTAAGTLRDPAFDRLTLFVDGVVRLAEGKTAAAIEPLSKAESTLRPAGIIGTPTEHAEVWFTLAEAQLAAGNTAAATSLFQRIVDSRIERVYQPIHYVRSFYFLGRIADQSGDRAKAREHYARFVGHWKDGDLDRDRVAEARRYLERP